MVKRIPLYLLLFLGLAIMLIFIFPCVFALLVCSFGAKLAMYAGRILNPEN